MTSKHTYLKRYMSKDGGNQEYGEKAKKKKRKKTSQNKTGGNLAILDDDVDWRSLVPHSKGDSSGEDDPEDKPLVAEGGVSTQVSLTCGVFSTTRRRHDSPDQSPPRRRHDSPDQRLPRRRHDSPDQRLPRRRHDSPDQSPHRRRHDSPDQSPPRRRHDSPDQSPPRRRHDSPDQRLPRRRHDSPDQSPPRRKRCNSPDESVPQRKSHDSTFPARSLATKQPQDAMTRPPQKKNRWDKKAEDAHPPRIGSESKESVIDRGHKQKNLASGKMTSGTSSGLQSAEVLRRENALAKEREEKLLQEMDSTVSGRGAETVYRNKMGRKVNPKLERLKQLQEEKKKLEEEEKFMEWGKGVATVKMTQQKLEDELYEMSKPLARYADDEDLERMLKDREREGDPMLKFMKKNPQITPHGNLKKERPTYKGSFPANRYQIRPGYRWDGVDRSNGFEKTWFAREANKKATSDMAYKWSVENM